MHLLLMVLRKRDSKIRIDAWDIDDRTTTRNYLVVVFIKFASTIFFLCLTN